LTEWKEIKRRTGTFSYGVPYLWLTICQL